MARTVRVVTVVVMVAATDIVHLGLRPASRVHRPAHHLPTVRLVPIALRAGTLGAAATAHRGAALVAEAIAHRAAEPLMVLRAAVADTRAVAAAMGTVANTSESHRSIIHGPEISGPWQVTARISVSRSKKFEGRAAHTETTLRPRGFIPRSDVNDSAHARMVDLVLHCKLDRECCYPM